VEGQYHSLGTFLDRVSKLERIVNVADIKISPLQPLQQQRSGRSVLADLKATTYTFLEKGEKGGSASAPAK
jgi:Tfp pilus assembly protein PilO